MRLDHLLSKDRYCVGVASWSWLSGLLMGLGRLGGCSCGEGQLIVSRGCVARGCGWLSVVGIGNTPAVVVGRCGCCGRGGLLVVGAPACWWGWHAVGVLG